jgi:hypothetical protein
MISLFELYDTAIANELGVDISTYSDIIYTKCSYWEGYYIISVFLTQDTNRMENAKNIFNSKLVN